MPTHGATTPATSQLDPDAMIAAIASKAPRRATGGARRKSEPAKRAETATPADAASRGARRSPPPAPAPTPEAATPSSAPVVATKSQQPGVLSRLLATLRARRSKADTQQAAAAVPFDPLAASVRNRARARSALPAPGTANDLAADAASPPMSAAAATVAAGATTSAAGPPPQSQEPATPAPAAVAPDPPATVPAVPQHAPAPPGDVPDSTAPAETPFVERRRNPDLPIPPGTIPPHPLRRRTDVVTPSFAVPRSAAAPVRRDWRWPAAVAALSLLLVLQLLLAQRDRLAADARWRPTVSALCTVLRCTLPPWREPAAFTMLGRDVRAHPSAPGALLIDASFRNDARWPQPWPRVLLTLSNVDGRIVGARAFSAREYLGNDAVASQRELAPGQTAAIRLAVVEPAPDIVAFSFDFR